MGPRLIQDFSIYSLIGYLLPFLFWQSFLTSPVAMSCFGQRFHSWAGKGWFWGSQGHPEPWGYSHQLPAPPAWSHPAQGAGWRAGMDTRLHEHRDAGMYGHTDTGPWARGMSDPRAQVCGCTDTWEHCAHGCTGTHGCMDTQMQGCVDTRIH